jgi:hypothetical protein
VDPTEQLSHNKVRYGRFSVSCLCPDPYVTWPGRGSTFSFVVVVGAGDALLTLLIANFVMVCVCV